MSVTPSVDATETGSSPVYKTQDGSTLCRCELTSVDATEALDGYSGVPGRFVLGAQRLTQLRAALRPETGSVFGTSQERSI
jgi:hypothetical protein